MYSSPTNKKQKPSTSYLVRPRSGPMRSIFASKPMSASTQDKKKKFKKWSSGKMDYRKKPDYADTAYREAVGRLRILLAESYTPIKRPLRDLDSAGEETDNQSLISGNSKTSKMAQRPYYQYLTMVPRRYYYPQTRPASVVPIDVEKNITSCPKFESTSGQCAPPELMSFIEKQEEYIEQLEKESRFCREELSSLLGKVKDVISENENLHERQKSNIMKSVFNHLETETETETDMDVTQKVILSPKKSKKTKLWEGPTIVFESRISELEAQLTQAKIDLKKALEDNGNYKKKIADGSIFDGLGFDHYKKQIENLQREKELLQETVAKLQSALSKIRDKENDTCDQVKRSLDAAEQAHFEKNTAELEIRRLKDELDRQHAKLRDAVADQSRRIADERSAVERRYTQQIEQLTTELGVQWETTNKLQLELDKQRRENTDLRRELAQKEALLDGMRKDMQTKIMSLQSDIGVNGAEKSALEQQIATLQMTNERNERQAKQEVTRLQAEMQSLRQRLDRADADLIHSRRENIRFTEQVASLEKEIKLNSALSEEKSKQPSGGEILALPPPKEQDKQLSSLIKNMESKHAATVAELEGMIHSQNQLMDKLSFECHTLTQKLEDASAKHKEEIRELQTSLNLLNSKMLNQSQITSSGVKDEDYNSTSNQRPAQSQDSTNKFDPRQTESLSRTNSKSSLKNNTTLSRKSSEEKVTPKLYEQSHLDRRESQPGNGLIKEPLEYTAVDNRNYDQQYVSANEQHYDPQTQYEQQMEPNNVDLYSGDGNQYSDSLHQYTTDPNQQYTMNPDDQYLTDPSQQYSADPNQQYGADMNDQSYVVDPNQVYGASTEPTVSNDPNQQYGAESVHVPYSSNVVDPNQVYGTSTEQPVSNDPNQQYGAESVHVPYSSNVVDPNQVYRADTKQSVSNNPSQQYGAESTNLPYSSNVDDQYRDRQYQY